MIFGLAYVVHLLIQYYLLLYILFYTQMSEMKRKNGAEVNSADHLDTNAPMKRFTN